MSSNTTPAEAAPALSPAPPADAPALAAAPEPPVPSEQPSEPAGSVTVAEDEVAIIAQNDTPELPPPPSRDDQVFADRTLPQTAGRSSLELMTGLAMLCGGIAVIFASRRKSQI